MNGIFGIVHLDDKPVDPARLDTMRTAMPEWGPRGSDILIHGPAGFGRMHMFSSPGSTSENIPCFFKNDGILFSAWGRVDNRDELVLLSGIEGQGAGVSDCEIILETYLKWGENCPARIYGDWALAAWHPKERKLFLARDHFGNTSLYYYADHNVFAFASSRKALLALNLASIKMDELYLAQVLTSWFAYHGDRTIHTPIKRLPPAHCLTVTNKCLDVRQYWRLEDTPELRLPRRKDYVEAFRDLFDEAVHCRLRTVGDIAVTLSGGLDSGAVTATAAQFLRNEGKRLTALTSVPLSDPSIYIGKNFGDEFPLARSTAQFAGNVDHISIAAESVTPIQAIRRMLRIHYEPAHAAANHFWMLELEETACAHGCRVLLTGQMGNAGISWTGDMFSQPLTMQIRHYGWRKWAKENTKRIVPAVLLKTYHRARMPKDYLWCKSSAILPDFARRLNLLEQRLDDSAQYPHTPQEKRFQILMPGRSFVGALHAQMGTEHGLEIRDPTGDARVLAFTLSVPDHIFMDPKTGMDRWLIREAMKGRLPDEVRLNRRRGRQAGDLVPRLRACAGEVETALDELASGSAAEYVNVPYMREVWRMVQTHDTPEAFHKSVTVLTRGIMAGLWVNGFYNAS